MSRRGDLLRAVEDPVLLEGPCNQVANPPDGKRYALGVLTNTPGVTAGSCGVLGIRSRRLRRRGLETGSRQTYTGTKPETADTAKGSLRGTAPVRDPTTLFGCARFAGGTTKERKRDSLAKAVAPRLDPRAQHKEDYERSSPPHWFCTHHSPFQRGAQRCR